MSFQAMAWAVKQKVGNATGKAILLMLANYADERGECFPSQEKLAEECECSIATVARWVKHFEDSGVLSRQKQYGEGGYRRADRLKLLTDLPVTKLPSTELPNSASKLTRHSDGAEPIKEPINPSSLRSEGKRTPRSELLAVLDADRADAVIEHRQRIRKPLTAHAAKLLAGKFARCPNPNEAADAMIANGWQGFEPEWMDRQQSRGSPPPRASTSSALADSAARLAQTMRTADEIRSGSSGSGVRAAIPHLPVR